MGIFAALLGGSSSGANSTATSNSSQNGFDFSLGNLLKLSFEAGVSDNADQETKDPQALAAAIDGPVQLANAATSKPLVDFIDSLTALKTSLDAGQPLDPELLGKVQTALDGLADALGVNLDQLSVPGDFSALLDGIDTGKADLSTTLASVLTPLAQSLAGAQPATTNGDIAQAGAAGDLLTSIGDKLAALIGTLEKGDVAADKLSALGMTPGQPLDSELEAALARFAASLGDGGKQVPDQPQLATPSLKLTEQTLTGKPADTADAATDPGTTDATAGVETTQKGDKSSGKDEGDNSSGGDRKAAIAADAKAERTQDKTNDKAQLNAAPAAVDASNAPQPAQQNQSQQHAMRVDAAANPRIVQTGYQTSQQQLNLPQIAFELARQTHDGNSRFQIRLDPPELGRIDVHLDIDRSGQINARLTVEKAETLDLMQRDQRGLERALQQAGVDSSKTNLEFSLKQNPFAGQQQQQNQQQSGSAGPLGSSGPTGTEEIEDVVPTVNLYRGTLQASGVNIIA